MTTNETALYPEDIEHESFVIGLCGMAGAGKTSSADRLVPPMSFESPKGNVTWDHLFLAMPLYEMAGIKRDIEGDSRDDRVKYEIHSVLLDIFGSNPLYGAPPYDMLIQMVNTIADMPMEDAGKPRTFLQDVGTLCRAYDKDCFSKLIERKIGANFRSHSLTSTKEYFITIVSDIRMPNEAEVISAMPNSLIIKLEASEEVRKNRLFARDGVMMTPQQASHHSEAIDLIDDDMIDYIIDTSDMSLNDQVVFMKDIISTKFDIELDDREANINHETQGLELVHAESN